MKTNGDIASDSIALNVQVQENMFQPVQCCIYLSICLFAIPHNNFGGKLLEIYQNDQLADGTSNIGDGMRPVGGDLYRFAGRQSNSDAAFRL